MIESIQAHTAAIWGMDLRADKGGLVTCSADKDVKFWDIRMKQVETGPGSRIVTRLGEERVIKSSQMGLVHVKTLKMTDDVLAVKYSPDGRLLAVSLLDSTVKVFFQDTLKFFLSLYGHKVSPRGLSETFADTSSASRPRNGHFFRLETHHHLLG
jgi:U3 small nucleolar RNA-associated protein 12